jgi:hypothetical protein
LLDKYIEVPAHGYALVMVKVFLVELALAVGIAIGRGGSSHTNRIQPEFMELGFSRTHGAQELRNSVPEFLGSWVPEFLGSWVSEFLSSWAPELQSS